MSLIEINGLSFSYPNSLNSPPALNNISISVAEGSLVTLCGCSGSGKSTLLRLLKPALAPHGDIRGEILYNGSPLGQLSALSAAREIGFVMQNTEAQLVSDRVWHEIAFAAESIGMEQGEIRRRVSEMAEFFGLEQVFESETAKLSGGQKQLVSLAAACVLQPRILLLDEPTSQLDPIAAQGFVDVLRRLNRDFGITVIIAEHRLEELLQISDRVFVLERGEIIADCPPCELLSALPKSHPMREALPASMRAFELFGGTGSAPITVREGRSFLRRVLPEGAAAAREEITKKDSVTALSAREIRFGYKRGDDVIRGASVDIHAGETLAIIGGNASGKSTMLKLFAGFIKPQSGRISANKSLKIELLPQLPAALFSKDTVREELSGNTDAVARFGLSEVISRNPLDLSGGEQQRLALAILWLRRPDLLLLDEPTKGMDAHAKKQLTSLLREHTSSGGAAVVVTHDAELAAECADNCALLFRGEIVSRAEPRDFFAGVCFYTTPFSRLSRGIAEGVYSAQTLAELLKGGDV